MFSDLVMKNTPRIIASRIPEQSRPSSWHGSDIDQQVTVKTPTACAPLAVCRTTGHRNHNLQTTAWLLNEKTLTTGVHSVIS